MRDRPEEDPQEAAAILQRAARRGLGPRPRLRRLAALLWSAFLGAVLMLLTWLFLEPEWHEAPLSFDRLAITFALCMALAAVPAFLMLLLSAPGNGDDA